MGWTFVAGETTKAAFAQRVAGECRAQAYTLRGNELWMIVPGMDGKPEILLAALASKNGERGYKDMPATIHPYYYDCPLEYLDQVPSRGGESEELWRAKVREHQASKASKSAHSKAIKSNLAVGRQVQLREGLSFKGGGHASGAATVIAVGDPILVQLADGRKCRVKARHIAAVL